MVSTTTWRTPEYPIESVRRPQQHHGSYNFLLHERAHTGGVRTDQRSLQFLAPIRRDHRGGERAEAGRHAVHCVFPGGHRFHDHCARSDGLDSRRACDHGRAIASDTHHIIRVDSRVAELHTD